MIIDPCVHIVQHLPGQVDTGLLTSCVGRKDITPSCMCTCTYILAMSLLDIPGSPSGDETKTFPRRDCASFCDIAE